MIYTRYRDLLKPLDLENFHASLGKPNGFSFNQLVNILKEEELSYKVTEGFDMNSSDKDINNFNKITLIVENEKKWKTICEEYSLEEVFKITKDGKNKYVIYIL